MGSKEEAIDFIFKNHPDPDTLFIGDKKHDSNTIQNVSSLMVNFTNEKTKQQREVIEGLAQIVKKYIEDRKGVAGLTPVGTNMYNDLHQEIKEAQSVLKEVE